MLVVDADTLEAIDLLDFGGDVLGHFRDAEQTQDIVRVARAIGDDFTLLDRFTFEDADLAPFRDQQLERITFHRRDGQTTLALGFLAEGHGTGDLGQDGRLFRTTCFEQVGNARQTTGDVLVTGRFHRDTCDDVTHADGCAILGGHHGIARQQVLDRRVGARQCHVLAATVYQHDHRTLVTGRGRT